MISLTETRIVIGFMGEGARKKGTAKKERNRLKWLMTNVRRRNKGNGVYFS